MDQDLKTILEALTQGQQAYATLGVLGAISAVTYALVRLYRLAAVQSLVVRLSPRAAWDSWPRWVKLLVVFGLSVATTVSGSLATGIPMGQAIIAGLVTGVGALGSDQVVSGVTKAGEKSSPRVDP